MLPPEKREVFKKLWLSGVKIDVIARTLEIRENEVSLYAKILGLPPRRKSPRNKKIKDEELKLIKEMRVSGATIREIAEYFEVNERTIADYLHAMGLKCRETQRCPNIPRGELEKLCLEGLTDEEIAKTLHITKNCVARLRQRYGINKRELARYRHREKLREIIYKILTILNEKGYTTSIELREKYGIETRGELLQYLESAIEEFRWFKLKYTSTPKYLIFPIKFNNLTIMYLKGEEAKVISFLFNSILDKNIPKTTLKYILEVNNAPRDLIKFL